MYFKRAGLHKTVVPVLVCGILFVNSRIKMALVISDLQVQVHFEHAGSHKTVVLVLACSILPEDSRIKLLF